MPLDVEKLIKENEKFHEFQGRRTGYLFFPCRKPSAGKRLLISFGAYNGNYNRVRGYYEELRGEYDLLYLANKGQYYLADKGDFAVEAMYTELIGQIIASSGVARKDIFCLGSSMGGFAALYYGFKFEVGKIVAICPLPGVAAFYKNCHPDIYRQIIADPAFDLDAYVFKMFEKKTATQTHIVFCRNDKKMPLAGTPRLLSSLVLNQNIFSFECHSLDYPEGKSAHTAISYLMTPDRVMELFKRDLHAAVAMPVAGGND